MMNRTWITPISYFGSRTGFLNRIMPHLDIPHQHFVDVFGGSGVFSLNMKNSPHITYNDLDRGLSNMYYIIKTKPAEFQRQVSLLPYSKLLFEEAKQIINEPTFEFGDVKAALGFFMLTTQSFIKDQRSWLKSSYSSDNIIEVLRNCKLRLPLVSNAVKNMDIRNTAAAELIPELDSPDTLYFIDPPHWHSDTEDTVYRCSMTMEIFEELFGILNLIKGKCCIVLNASEDSKIGYFRELLSNYNKVSDWVFRNNPEVLLTNYDQTTVT